MLVTWRRGTGRKEGSGKREAHNLVPMDWPTKAKKMPRWANHTGRERNEAS
jgi:hypothetical protein